MKNSIAIVGIGAVFPGANDLDGFWEMVRSGANAAREVPSGRWILDPAEAIASEVSADKVNSKRGCFVDDCPFDPQGLNLDAATLAGLDPVFHLLLHAGNEAWRDAATSELDRQRVGVIIGNIVLPTDASSALADEILGPAFESKVLGQAVPETKDTLRLNRYVAGLPAGVLAKALELGGGSYTLDAACASSLYALKYAAEELLAGRADAMLAGGLSRPDCLYTQMGFSQLGAISRSGLCSPFDHKGDGLVVGEGAGIVVLKRLEDALSQGDEIHATIAGIGLSNDVGGNLMSPDSEGQQRAMLAAYEQADWSPGDVDLIECHGTGTPVGDVVEFNSLQRLWQDERQSNRRCVIGSVKSNIGHLLTAAGSAGLIKVLLAMKHGQLPPTANFEQAASGLELNQSPFEVLTQARDWSRRGADAPRRAAISAFGFGGINAHVLLEEWRERKPLPAQKTENAPAIAVVGMEAQFGPWRSLEQFRQRVFGFDQDCQPGQPKNWWGVERQNPPKGFFIDDVAVPLDRYRIPPAELREMLPQQLLMLQVAATALDDAGMGEVGSADRPATGVFIGIGLDLNTTNFHFRWSLANRAKDWNQRLGLCLSVAELESWASSLRDAAGPALNANRTMGALGGIVASRIARAFRIGGPSFTVSGEEASGLRALESGMRSLQRGEIDTAVVGAVDLAGDVRATLGQIEDRPLEPGGLIGEGATALVLKRHEDALRDGDRIYALIQGVGSASEAGVEQLLPTESAYKNALQRACKDAGVTPASIGLIERHGSGIPNEENMEARALGDLSATSERVLPCALASIKSDIGHCGAAGALASVARASLSLYHQTLPPEGAGESARYWLHDQGEDPRRAAVASFSVDGNCLHAILGAVSEQAASQPKAISDSLPAALFALEAATDEDLLAQLQQLASELSVAKDEAKDAAMDIHRLAQHWWRQDKLTSPSRLSLLAVDTAALSKCIEKAAQAVRGNKAIASDGVFYSPEPLGVDGKIAFVYPGSGNHFQGMGRELALQWPAVLDRLNQENQRLGSQFAQGRFWQDSPAIDLDHEAVIFGQVWVGTMVSDMVAQFGLAPDAVIGYSLGETAGLFSTRTWTDRDEMLRRMQATDLFTEQLAGPCKAVRESWGLEKDQSVDWLIGMVGRSRETVRKALEGKDRVYLLIVNTPHECVIGGDRATVQALSKELGCVFHPIQGVTTVHCEVAGPVEKAYRDLHLFDTTPPEGVRFYSGVWGRSYDVNTDSCADSILQQALQSFDYTKVINTAFDDGARIFIEMGPGASCTRMIGQILGDRPHLAKALCVPSQDNVGKLLELLASLHAEGVSLDLAPLFSNLPAPQQDTGKGPQIVVATGGQPFEVPAPPARAVRSEDSNVALAREAEKPATVVSIDRVSVDMVTPQIDQMQATEIAKSAAHETFLRVSNGLTETLTQALGMQMSLLQSGAVSTSISQPPVPSKPVAFDREQCMEFAIGSIGKVLGSQFADVDQHPSRVRLPDEPLMLVDRILVVAGERDGMGSGRVITEHDVLPGAWYLDGGRIPTCIAVEAGQADLFLSAYLGIDHQTRGQAVYRLLDAKITFHGPLPRPGDTIHYDIQIDHFFRQDQTWLFRFGFEGSVNGQPLLSMTEGCAGFFSQEELDAGRGIVQTSLERQSMLGKMPADWQPLVPMQTESFDDAQIAALAGGNLEACFGPAFANLDLRNPVGLPGGRMRLVHRILELDPNGGRFGIGQITGEADIQPDDWFLTCHFSDDQVMPGTLMYECCLHTLRVHLLRMGWVGEADEVVYEPIQGEISQLKCRGQVLASTSRVQYQITLKEIGFKDDGTPFVLADALMSADGRAIVQMNNMSVQISGLTRAGLATLWAGIEQTGESRLSQQTLFDFDSIYAFARGKPSEAFGERYKVFDSDRVIARLPGPPYQFLDRIVAIDNCQQWELAAGGEVVAEYDVPTDAWYFEQDRQQRMPLAVLLEVALQPCGWLAAYLGSALTSETDLSFRNLGGKATQFLTVAPDTGTLSTRIKITNVSQSGGMIIQSYDLEVRCAAGLVYKGDTTFGFFSKQSLADQVGIREAKLYQPTEAEQVRGQSFAYPQQSPYPDDQMRMVHEVELFDPEGGQHSLGFIQGTARVDPEAWFFKAHFFQDPVWPGSLGLESLIQLLKVVALDRWQDRLNGVRADFQVMALGQEHSWVYRGQIIPTDRQVTVQATVLAFDDETMTLRAEGFLSVDGRIIYQMNNFGLKLNG